MRFSVGDFSDLVRLLRERPEWREELAQLLLSQKLLTLPDAILGLVESQQRAEERLSRLEAAMQSQVEQSGLLVQEVRTLVESQHRTEESLRALAESQRHMQDAWGALARSQRHMQDALGNLAQSLQRTQDTLGSVRGYVLELRYPEKAAAYFSRLLTGVDVVKAKTLEDILEKKLDPEEVQQVLLLDCLLRGRTRHRTEPREVWLAVEISGTVYPHDVERAAQRAGLLQRAGYPAIPVATGEDVTEGAKELARTQKVVLALDGTVLFWDEALPAWVS